MNQVKIKRLNDHAIMPTRGSAEAAGFDLYVNDNPPGIATDWNYAISKAETQLVTIAHQDDIYAPDYLEDFEDELEDEFDDDFFEEDDIIIVDTEGDILTEE